MPRLPIHCAALAGLVLFALSSCTVVPPGALPAADPKFAMTDEERAVARFSAVADRVAPVAEDVCKAEARGRNCDFLILMDEEPGAAANAFQSQTRGGRPVIVFTLPLVEETRNADELAFVLGHETAHHILGHLERTESNARYGAAILAGMAEAEGYDAQIVQNAADLGAEIGARSFSQDYELEADALGAVITKRAGYDPVRGAAYFTRIPDPGEQFLGTHPPNAERMALVRRVTASLQ
ncbi:M48 family metalloprotease [Tropicimonas sp. IMCC34043]|uniref:M48 family metalloprotease n=1 Tax=Tropicimonas sp. IMCC34043 TaxID=2248760 RepID=UPI000E273B69|nr:M48 family metalloprotease [Tropicimonas sp. IMCC34043]